MFHSAQYNPLIARRRSRRLACLAAAASLAAGLVGSVALAGQSPRVAPVVAPQVIEPAQHAPQRRAVRVIQIYNLPAQPAR